MKNQVAIIYVVNSHIDKYIDGTHPNFEYKGHRAYKITFDITDKNPRTNEITFTTFNRGDINDKFIQMTFDGIHNSTMLEMIKTHQHIGHWDCDKFIITDDIKKGGK